MRFASYNIEWFCELFDDANRLHDAPGPSGRHGIDRLAQAGALARVLRAIDADAVMVIEAPDHGRNGDTCAALEAFAARYGLRLSRAMMGFANDTRQEIALWFDPARLTARHAPSEGPADASEPAPRFDDVLRIDLDIDARQDVVRFSKPPLELDLTTAAGTALHVIGAHLKSKAPHGARNRDEAMRIAIANRRKQLAQAIWLRRRIEARLAEGRSLMVMGDLNDGPGLDEYEHLFGRSSVEIVMGMGDGQPQLHDPHARRALQSRLGAAPTSARFYIAQESRYLQALLDYILVSPDLLAHGPRWRIWHPFDDPDCWSDPALREALLTASDHFPVTLDIDI